MESKKIHIFAPGEPYRKVEQAAPADYLKAALEAERGIAARARETEDGIYWEEQWIHNPVDTVDLSFGLGTAGIVYFYIQLVQATEDASFVPVIEKGLRYISRHMESVLPKGGNLPWLDGMQYGIYNGIGGIGSVFLAAYKLLGETAYLDEAQRIAAFLKQDAKQDADGTYFAGSFTTLTDGGVLMFLTDLYALAPQPELRALLESAGSWYLAQGRLHEDGGLEFADYETARLAEPDYPYDVAQPNFELGTSGAGFVLLRLYKALGDRKYLDAAKAAEVYLASISIPQEKGFLIPYRVGGPEEPFFYLGHCHGVAGTGKFYYDLYEITGDRQYLDKLHALFDGAESFGAPDRMSAGLWNNVSVCCGQGGYVNIAAGLYGSLGEDRWLELGRRAAAILLAEKDLTEDGQAYWTIAYQRIKPSLFSSTIFYNNGTAGIASALLQLYMAENGKKNRARMGDDPFPES